MHEETRVERHRARLPPRHDGVCVAAQARSSVDLSSVYYDLRTVDQGADWYLHPNRRLLLCDTAKAPPRVPSRLTLVELVHVIQGGAMFGALQ